MYKIYQVEYGDTIESIAKKTGTTSSDIKNINGINSNSDLIVGSLIIVPKQDNQAFEVYRVKQGDTIYSIARLYNINPETLLLVNGLNKNDYIYPNQELTVPKGDVDLYVTKPGDTLSFIVDNLGIDANTLNKENKTIFVMEDQLIIHKKETNN